jgi:Ca2+-binding EF-hand superfamily protein
MLPLIIATNKYLNWRGTKIKSHLRDGNIDFLEFVVIMMKQIQSRDEEQEIKEAFQVFSDGAEFIPSERIKLIMMNLGEELDDQGIQRMVQEADFDGDGKISYKDFCLCMQNLSKEEGAHL